MATMQIIMLLILYCSSMLCLAEANLATVTVNDGETSS
ncbi:hypothetical protein ECP03018678_2152, partial [Escherichia coli P0301867.8]